MGLEHLPQWIDTKINLGNLFAALILAGAVLRFIRELRKAVTPFLRELTNMRDQHLVLYEDYNLRYGGDWRIPPSRSGYEPLHRKFFESDPPKTMAAAAGVHSSTAPKSESKF